MSQKRYTDKQILSAVEERGSQAAAAVFLGMHTRSLKRRLAEIRENGVNEDEVFVTSKTEIPHGHIVKGTSTLYDAETGEPKLEWVKTDLDKQAKLDAIRSAVDSLVNVDAASLHRRDHDSYSYH
jgi:hypothetical protein